ncbi:MAG: GlsB/YeaQ/YmgE family stress response membrane protein [Aggregatilineales bacterium]
MTLDIGQIIVWVIIGALAGSMVGWLIRGRKKGFGTLTNIVLGMVGAVVGGFLFELLNVSISNEALTFSVNDLVSAVVGSLVIVGLMALIRR